MAQIKVTTNHQEIQRWVEEREGKPAQVTEPKEDILSLSVSFLVDNKKGKLKLISWKQFFDHFERYNLAFVYKDEPESRFVKFIHR